MDQSAKLIFLTKQYNKKLLASLEKSFGVVWVQTGDDLFSEMHARDFRVTHIPHILLLDNYNSTLIEQAIENGIDDYLIGPFSQSVIRQRVAINIARTKRYLDVNPLTYLPGNRSIRSMLKRNDPERSVLYIDINNFKKYNDTYGFLEGDKVILATAQVLTHVLEQHGDKDDFLGHVGGDDFIMITKKSRESSLREMVEKFCEQEIPQVTFSVIPLIW